jgi:putative ABC transport system ATP-binding protein
MMLSAKDLSVAFVGRPVLDSFSVDLEDGEQCALLGRSGSGKTTLLLVLAGLLLPTSGAVQRDVRPDEVVYVPQAPSLVPELTALQNATLGLRIRGVAPGVAEVRARELLGLVGLEGLEHALPSELSGGMQQRVALARALAVEPRLLLVDEPTGALDQATGARVVDALQEVAVRTSATVVVATHDPGVAARFARQIILDGVMSR